MLFQPLTCTASGVCGISKWTVVSGLTDQRVYSTSPSAVNAPRFTRAPRTSWSGIVIVVCACWSGVLSENASGAVKFALPEKSIVVRLR